MRLLFDQNLSPQLPRLLSDLYPGSVHVREVGMREADDSEIWSYALRNDFVIVSKDSDFQQQSLLFGPPPKFVWLRMGNCSTGDVFEVIRKFADAIDLFGKNKSESHLRLP